MILKTDKKCSLSCVYSSKQTVLKQKFANVDRINIVHTMYEHILSYNIEESDNAIEKHLAE